MTPISTLDWLEAHLSKSLSEKERNNLENKLLTDAEFKEEFAFLLATRQAAKAEYRTSLRGQYFQQKKTRVAMMRRIVTAASIVGICFALWQLRPALYNNSDKIYALYEKDQKINLIQRSTTTDSLSLAEERFKAQKYTEVLPILEAFLVKEPNDLELKYYKAITLRNIQGKEQEAIQLFEELSTNATLGEDAEWEKALTLLKLDEIAACRELLQKIMQEDNHDHKTKAKKLLKQMRKL